MGFYNKYIYLSNSYLSIYIARETCRKNYPIDSKKLEELIDNDLKKEQMKRSLKLIKQKNMKKIL
jgi:hypothetical protein